MSGLAPRWAAQQPQNIAPELSGTLQRSYWDCYAAQRGASPLTTGPVFALNYPWVIAKGWCSRRWSRRRKRKRYGEWTLVVSGLAPRWAAQPPQNTAPELSGTLQRSYWGCYAAQRGASPLTTGTVFALNYPWVIAKGSCSRRWSRRRKRKRYGEWILVVSGLAPRWAEQPPQNIAPELSGTLQRSYWGCYAAQRGASPLITGPVFALNYPWVIAKGWCSRRWSRHRKRKRYGEWILVVSGLAPRWAAQPPQNTAPELSGTLQRSYWGCYAAQRGASPLTTGTVFALN